ncbi:MAG TPA: alginate lyase family protein [Bacteroidota bacterium]|nr:alginate lyase family protein [Bacteroidota bacterium]
MNLGDIKTPGQFWHLVKHRVVRPKIWQMWLSKRLVGMSDIEFLRKQQSALPLEEFMKQFHETVRLKFFFHPRNQKDFFMNLLTKTQDEENILVEAQNVLENRFQCLGSGLVYLGENIDWQKDFKSGNVWPLKDSKRMAILDGNESSDIKVPWELSRFHQVWWLGKAYWLTRNEEYAEKFRTLVEHWIENNPPGRGVNWMVAMEAAIRAANWISGYYFFCESRSLSADFWVKFLRSLYAHGTFIENNLEVHWRNSNHFLSNIAGMIFLGVLFQNTAFGKRSLQWGVRSLAEEMERQVYPDGVDYEKSTSYQRLVLELFYTPAILCILNNIRMPAAFMNHLERMFEYVQHYTRPDGSIPLFGDADDGRLFRLIAGDDINDHRHALAVGAILFDRADFAQNAAKFSQDALWLFGGEGFEKFQRLKGATVSLTSRAFPDGGFYIMRSDNAHITVDAGDIGMKGWGGHGHNDILSFELWANGEPVIVDSGTYAYTFDVAARQEFRSIRAHNTVMIDRKEPVTFVGLWMILRDKTRPRVNKWKTEASSDILEAEHRAYRSLLSPVTHRRRIELDKARTRLHITDIFEGTGVHTFDSFLHFAPTITLRQVDLKTFRAIGKNAQYVVTSSEGQIKRLDSWFSRSYGVRQRNQALQIAVERKVPFVMNLDIQCVSGGQE